MTKNDTTKTRILLAAGPIFAQKGFKAATVREICDAAEVNVASVNYYFGDKQALYIDSVVYARQMRVEKVPTPKWSANTTAEEKLGSFIEMALNRMVALKSAPWQVRLLMREILQPTEACRKLVRDYFRPFIHVLMGIIDEIVGSDLSQEKRLQLAFSIIGQCMYYRFAADMTAMVIEDEGIDFSFDTPQLAEHITQFSLAAIKNLKLTDLPSNPQNDIQSPTGSQL